MKTAFEGIVLFGFVALLLWVGSEEAGDAFCRIFWTWMGN